MNKPLPCPSEEEEQIRLFNWAAMRSSVYPELKDLFHIPNGGLRSKPEAARMKAAGVKPGVSDIFLPAPRGQYHGLFIELKRQRGGKASDEQKVFINKMRAAGYAAEICHGWEKAAECITAYLERQNWKGETE